MSRGNFFTSINTQHYFYIPSFYRYGLSYLDAYGYNTLRNPYNAIAQQAREITSHEDVNIYNNEYEYITEWLYHHLGVHSFYWENINLEGDLVSSNINTMNQGFYDIDVGTMINALEIFGANTYEEQAKGIRDGDRMYTILNSIRTSVIGYAIGIRSDDTWVGLYFPQPNANRNDRTIATKGTNLINAIPRRASGARYHYRATEAEDVAVYVDNENLSVDDHGATVAGTMKLKWNKIQKVFESGQTFLAVLVTDVDGANIVKNELTIANMEGASHEDYYGSKAPFKMFEFTTGVAMPLGLETPQPQSFGPNIIKCGGETRAETIRVVNRSRTNYDSGEVVIIHQIDGENIIGGKFSETTLEQRPPEPGRWNFTKFFANSDEYFRISVPGLNKSQGRPNALPDEIVDILYQRYYMFDNRDAYNYLSDDATSIPVDKIESFQLFEYYQSHIDDITAHFKPNRINIYVDPAGGTNIGADMVYQEDVPLFFGPMFPDGISSKVGEYDKYQTPGEYVYPFMYNAHGAIRAINNNQYKFTYEDKYTTSGIIQAADLSRVQFSLCSCELLGAGDQASLQLPKDIADRGRFGSADTKPRRFPEAIATLTKGALNANSAGLLTRPAVNRKGGNGLTEDKIARKFGRGAMAAMYRGFAVPAGFGDIIPYDAYIDYVPLNSPKNAPAIMGGDTGPESTVGDSEFLGGTPGQYVGSNAVGITSARLRMNQGSGGSWMLNVATDQTFGMMGRFYGGGGGGGIIPTIIGAFMAFSTDTRGRTIQGSVPMWGSNKGDSIDSFGTAACHIQVWDAWPDEDTTWIPQYMCALHFNPTLDRTKDPNKDTVVTVKNYSSASKNRDGDWVVEPKDFDIKIPKPSLVSYQVPTYAQEHKITYTNSAGETVEQTYTSYGHGQDGVSVPDGPFSGTLRPSNLWNTFTEREGKLVTKYGYHWRKSVIGLNDAGATVREKEKGFLEGKDHIYKVGRGLKEARFWINGGGIVFEEIEWTDNSLDKNKEKVRGEGYLPQDVPFTTTVTDPNGKQAKVTFNGLYVHRKHYHDVGPMPRSGLQRVSMPSGAGTARMFGPSSSSISVTGNKTGSDTDLTLYSGQYEIFVYVHNDVGFAWHNAPEYTAGTAQAQFITIKLS